MQKNELKKESPKLLPCPFCGGEARIQHYRNGDCAIECIECYGKTHRSVTEDLAIRRWNTRKPIDRIVEQLEEKTEFLKDCTKYGNKNAKQQEQSYSTMMMYEVADLVDELIDTIKAGGIDG